MQQSDFGVAATLVRSDKTTSLTGIYLDRNDNDVYLKLTASGISNFGACSGIVVDPTKVTFASAGGVPQTVILASAPFSCAENSPSAYFRVDLSGIAAASTGAYSITMDTHALTIASGSVGNTNATVITSASKAMIVGYPVSYTIVDADEHDMSTTSRQLAPGGAYYLRIARADGAAFGSAPAIDVSKLTITKAGVFTTDLTVTAVGTRTTRLSSGIVDLPLTVATSSAAAAYVFSVEAGLLTFSTIQTGKWASCLSQDVGIAFSAQIVDANGNDMDGRTIDVSAAGQRVFFIRLWRNVGAFATSGSFNLPIVNSGPTSGCYGVSGSATAPCVTIRRIDALAPSPTSSATPSNSAPATATASGSSASTATASGSAASTATASNSAPATSSASGTPSSSAPSSDSASPLQSITSSPSGSSAATASASGTSAVTASSTGSVSPPGTPASTSSPSGTALPTATSTTTGSPLQRDVNIDFVVYRSTATHVDFKVTLTTAIPAGLYSIDFGEGECHAL